MARVLRMNHAFGARRLYLYTEIKQLPQAYSMPCKFFLLPLQSFCWCVPSALYSALPPGRREHRLPGPKRTRGYILPDTRRFDWSSRPHTEEPRGTCRAPNCMPTQALEQALDIWCSPTAVPQVARAAAQCPPQKALQRALSTVHAPTIEPRRRLKRRACGARRWQSGTRLDLVHFNLK